MPLHFDDFALTITAGAIEVPYGSTDEILFLQVRQAVLDKLREEETEIVHFGYAPDNTADAQDELLTEGAFFRIIGYEKNLGIDLDSSPYEIKRAFAYLLENYQPFWSTIIVEQGVTKTQVTIELLYQDVF